MLISDRSINEYVIENFRVYIGVKFVKIIFLMYIFIRYYFCVIKKFNVLCCYFFWIFFFLRYRWFNKFYLKKFEWLLIFFYIKIIDIIFVIFFKCLYLSDEKRYLMMKFFDFFFWNDIVWNKIYKSIKI